MEKNKKRHEGIELLRIFTMFMILILHYCSKGGFTSEELFYNKVSEVAWILKAFSIVAVNCFVIVTGYFLINSDIKYKKILKIWKQVICYSISIFLIFKVKDGLQLSLNQYLEIFLPIILRTYWFISIYVILYLLSPYINVCLKSINEHKFKTLLIILLLISFISSIMIGFGFDVIDSSNGYGLLWFITLYCLGAYIRLYEKNDKYKVKHLMKYILISMLIYVSRVVLLKLCENGILDKDINTEIFYKYNSITVAFSSIYLFKFFKNINIKNKFLGKCILKVAPLTLAVYIIHETPLIRNVLYKNILHTGDITNLKKFIIALPISCIAIFSICCIIELLRLNIFKLINNLKNKIILKKIKEEI